MEMSASAGGSAERMQLDNAISHPSSSPISSPPNSPRFSETIHVAPRFSHPGVFAPHPDSASASRLASGPNFIGHTSAATTADMFTTAAANGSVPEKPKRQRKKKEPVDTNSKLVDDVTKAKPKQVRKPREPKDKTLATPTPPPTSSATGARKKQKISDTTSSLRQSTINDMVNSFPSPAPPPTTTISAPSHYEHKPSDNTHHGSGGLQAPAPAIARPISSGRYDPVRGYDPVRAASLETTQTRPASVAPLTVSPAIPTQSSTVHVNRASASPSIASLIDPPSAIRPATSNLSYHPPSSTSQSLTTPSRTPPKASRPGPAPVAAASSAPSTQKAEIVRAQGLSTPVNEVVMSDSLPSDVHEVVAVAAKKETKAVSKSSSSAATPPKTHRPTPPPILAPPKGTGSGLLSTSDFFGGSTSNDATERKGVNIDIRITLNPNGGNSINIASEIAKKYGRDALNPRAAAHRQRLLQVAAAANKLDGGSADDMSVDLVSEPDFDSNVEMGGMDDEKSGEGLNADGKVSRKKKKTEEYDKDDDFIDDTELAWQEQAAVAKDGFFVYSGPLIPVGQDAQVETSAPASRGRGRGRGRGARGGAASATNTAVAEKTRDPALPLRGRGSRGGRIAGAPRKPRVTKAERERLEAEKMERERIATKITGATNGVTSGASTSSASAYHPRALGTAA